MQVQPVIAVFDIGRTNKKLLLFDPQYRLVKERSVQLPETLDEDEFPTEDLELLSNWVISSFDELLQSKDLRVLAVNISAYGASLVHLDSTLKPLTPLYSYLKPFPSALYQEFNQTYDADGQLGKVTASPELGNLNSGMQLYRLKKQQPAVFHAIRYSLHLPQYISFLLSGRCFSDLTSIGCHTRLWDFERSDYHAWAKAEGLPEKLAPVFPGDDVVRRAVDGMAVGVGLHDSSAALIPYLSAFHEPFVLISTGTWSISLNPFNQEPLTSSELQQDCLCFLSYQGKPVKASRLFAGHDHEIYTRRLAEHFQCSGDYYLTVKPDQVIFEKWLGLPEAAVAQACATISGFNSYEEAYHAGMVLLMHQQKRSTDLVMGLVPAKWLFVDGGFSKNPLFMQLMARTYPAMKVFAASLAQASALGAAQAIHQHWNAEPLRGDLLELNPYF